MKKFLVVTATIIIFFIVGILTYSYISFNFYSPEDPDVKIEAEKLAYYHNSYAECREGFHQQAEKLKAKFDSVEFFSVPVKSKTDTDLTIDFCYIPAKDTTLKLMVINSGIHGIEGFVGSAVQQILMAEFFEPKMTSEVGILIVHGMNAWGFKNERRFSENNVDLNRNFSLKKSLFSTKNDGFVALYDMLTPKGKVNMNSIKNKFFMLTAIKQIAQKGMPALLQAFAQGQYQFEEGIYYGGNSFEQQVEIISEALIEKSEPYKTVLSIDLHTGFGERGKLHLFPNPVDDPEIKQKMETIFAGHQIDWGDSDNFYTVSGQFVEFIGELLPNKTSIPMVLEFGTLNTSTTIGAIKSAHISILENQGAKYGYKSEKDREKTKAGYYEMFYPVSEKWRTNALTISLELMPSVMQNFQNL